MRTRLFFYLFFMASSPRPAELSAPDVLHAPKRREGFILHGGRGATREGVVVVRGGCDAAGHKTFAEVESVGGR